MKLAKILLVAMVIGTMITPSVFAAETPVLPDPVKNWDDLLAVVDKVLGFIFGILLIMSAVVILIAGYTYVTSKGEPGKVKEATNMIVYAAIGLIIAMLSNVLRNIIPTILD